MCALAPAEQEADRHARGDRGDRRRDSAWPSAAATTFSRSTESPCIGCGRTRCGGRRRRCRADGAAPPSRSASRFLANWPIRFVDTSASTPRPNCAALPEMVRSVVIDDVGGVALVLQLGGDERRGVAAAPRLLAAGLDDHALGGLVLLLERGFALVGHRDRADLDLHRAGEVVAVDRKQLGAGDARRDALDVGEHLPCLGRGHRDSEFVVQLHGQWSFPGASRLGLFDQLDDRGGAGGQPGERHAERGQRVVDGVDDRGRRRRSRRPRRSPCIRRRRGRGSRRGRTRSAGTSVAVGSR